MDIRILLALQEFRNGSGACLVDFLSKMTYLGEMTTVLIITALIYWCVNKEFGRYLLMGWSTGRVVNGFLKVTACAYRPWIRDAAIQPESNALATATGYSFPSGHSMNGAALYGGTAIRRDFPKMLRFMCGVMVLLVAFSRNYLGVHTPQDTVVGVTVGVALMWLTAKLIAWVGEHPEKDVFVMAAAIAVSVAVAIYASVKPYPVDYDAAGKVLVDGAKMANDTFKGVGWCVGFFAGWVLERRSVGFSTDVPMATRVTRLMTGLFLFYAITLILNPMIKAAVPGPVGTLATCFLQMFYVVFLFPWGIKRFEHEQRIDLRK